MINSRCSESSPPKSVYRLVIGVLPGVLSGVLLVWPLSLQAQVPGDAASGGRGGFAEPVPVIPEVGLWADAMSELGYAARPGVVLWWGLEPEVAEGDSPAGDVDWSKYTFRVRVEVFDADGKRVAGAEKLVDPLRRDDVTARGGFPTSEHLVVGIPGTYRARLEAYPLVNPAEVGLDSVPRGRVEVDVLIATRTQADGSGWLIGDLLFLHSLEEWLPGSEPERTWYEWVIYPNVPRSFAPDSSGALMALEIERGDELVPRCILRSCRVVISVFDEDGGIVEQTMRQVPDQESVTAYVIPIRTADLVPGRYRAQVKVYEADSEIVAVSRSFTIREDGAREVRESSTPEVAPDRPPDQ